MIGKRWANRCNLGWDWVRFFFGSEINLMRRGEKLVMAGVAGSKALNTKCYGRSRDSTKNLFVALPWRL